MMAANMLNLRPDEVDLGIMGDCVKESLNMICGNFLRKLDPQKVFNLSIPTFNPIDGGDEETETQNPEMDLVFVADGGHVRLTMTAPAIL